jgi:hypothetical protein
MFDSTNMVDFNLKHLTGRKVLQIVSDLAQPL